MPSKKSKDIAAAPALSTAPPKALADKLPSGDWRTRAALAAGFVGVGVAGVLIGRASSHVAEPPPAASSAPRDTASSPYGTPDPPQQFDLTEVPQFKSGVPIRPMDRDIFEKIMTMQIERSQMRDAFPDRPYRVSFVGSVAQRHIAAVLIDLNRDGQVDERWELKRGEVDRLVMLDPNAGGQPVKYTLAHGRWQPH